MKKWTRSRIKKAFGSNSMRSLEKRKLTQSDFIDAIIDCSINEIFKKMKGKYETFLA